MLKWAKGSKSGRSSSGQAARVGLAELRRASARLLRRKDSSSSKSKNASTACKVKDAHADNSPPPPAIPPRKRNPSNTSCPALEEGVIKQATVRSLRQNDPGSSSSGRPAAALPTNKKTCAKKNGTFTNADVLALSVNSDNGSLYMQLDKIPVAVQSKIKSGRKVLEDISNQSYRDIIHDLQDELSQLTTTDEEDRHAHGAPVPLTHPDVKEYEANHAKVAFSDCAPVDVSVNKAVLPADGVASFTNLPPGDLHRPRPVRHPSPTFQISSCAERSSPHVVPEPLLGNRGEFSNLSGQHSRSMPPLGYHFSASPVKKTCIHNSTGQHLHMNVPPRSLASSSAAVASAAAKVCNMPQQSSATTKKARSSKTVTFQNDCRLNGDVGKLPIVFEMDQEDNVSRLGAQRCVELEKSHLIDEPSKEAAGAPLMLGFVNVPCSRRGFCDFGSGLDKFESNQVSADASKCVQKIKRDTRRECLSNKQDWQPSYVNLEDTEIAPVLLASSRPIDESQDFWKPKSVASAESSLHVGSPVYDSPKTDDNLLLEFPFRCALLPPIGRRTMSNSSGSDTQDSGVAELAQPLSFSRAASASPLLVVSGRKNDFVSMDRQPFYNTLPRTDKHIYWSQCSSYDNTDPHLLSATASSLGTGSQGRFAHNVQDNNDVFDQADVSWSSDHLYCNMAPVDPLPLLPPRVSRRCQSLLGLATKTEDADYENVELNLTMRRSHNVDKLNISHSRSRSLRHSGDFSCLISPTVTTNKDVNGDTADVASSSSCKRQQQNKERIHRLELMLNDQSALDYSNNYEPSDWSMEAILSDTVRDLDAVSLEETDQEKHTKCYCLPHHCSSICCQCHCPTKVVQSIVFINSPACKNHSKSSAQCPHKRKKQAVTIRQDNEATQTDGGGGSLCRPATAENPLYMAYNDLTKIDDYDRTANVNDDYSSDGCETWNSHRVLYARMKHNQQKACQYETPKKKRTSSRRCPRNALSPSSGRILRHGGKTASTPSKCSLKTRFDRSANTSIYSNIRNSSLANSDKTYCSTTTYRRACKNKRFKALDVLCGKGQLQLSMYLNSGLLTLHVISARNLKSSRGKPCNTYVKISLIPDGPEKTFCRTTLMKNDNNPWFDQKFSFEFLSGDLHKRLILSVWNRDTNKNRSEFLGCMSFGVGHVIRKDVCGWYRLLKRNIGRKRHFAVQGDSHFNNSTVDMERDLEDGMVAIDDGELSDAETRAADDRSTDKEKCAASLISTSKSVNKEDVDLVGKTPYTFTVNLQRGPKGYGFSVTWTHPPRIERVEPGLSADLSGMRFGDYIVFVGNHNVVKMAEEQVLQLIQSAGDTLTLEIYRKGTKSCNMTSEQLTMAELQSNPGSVNGSESVLAINVVASNQSASSSQNVNLVVVPNVRYSSHIQGAALKVAFNKSIGGGILV